MAKYLGKIHAFLHEFNKLLPPAYTLVEELEQQSKFFMLLALHVIYDEYFHVRDQILGSLVVPNFIATSSTLLRVQRKQVIDIPTYADDFSVLSSQRDDCNHSSKLRKGRPKCDHCGKLGHKSDECYVLHGHPPRSAIVVHFNRPP